MVQAADKYTTGFAALVMTMMVVVVAVVVV
jgi:hypothetical protein